MKRHLRKQGAQFYAGASETVCGIVSDNLTTDEKHVECKFCKARLMSWNNKTRHLQTVGISEAGEPQATCNTWGALVMTQDIQEVNCVVCKRIAKKRGITK